MSLHILAVSNNIAKSNEVVLFILIYNPGQNICHKLKRYNKIGQDFKNIISNFACFLTAIVNV